jgi:starch-binding outer membrane protein, SusD/RagB family
MYMKTRKIYSKSLAAFLIIVAFTSCTDLFNEKDIKQNPNAPLTSQVNITPLMTGSLLGIGMLHEDSDVRIAYMWGGQLAGQSRQHQGFQNYTVAASTFGWTNYYNTGQNIRLIQQRASAVNNKVHLGAAQVMEALLFTKLISLWGDVPYSEAFDIENHPTPKYDGQLAVYAALVTLLNTAYTNLNSGIGKITGDFITGTAPKFEGVPARWAKFAKSLQARLYLHLKDFPNAVTAAKLGIDATSGDMLMPHGGAYQIDFNQNFSFFDFDRSGDTSFDAPAYLPTFMCTDLTSGTFTVDVAKRNAKTDETGMYYHFFQYEAETSGLDPNTVDGMFVATAPQPWLTFYETQFILAEALARQSATSVADPDAITALNAVRAGLATGYINGLTTGYASEGLIYTAYTAGDFTSAGVANPAAKSWTPQKALLTEIASEKFVVMLSQYEVFNELRRLRVAAPVVSLGIPIFNGTKYPERFIYPQNEINTNPNVPKVSGSAPDQFVKLPIFQ